MSRVAKLFLALAAVASLGASLSCAKVVNGDLVLTNIPSECKAISIRILKRDDTGPGSVTFSRTVVDGKVRITLGPEFVPHNYGPGDLRIECVDSQGRVTRTLVNKDALNIGTGEQNIDNGLFEEQ